MSEMTANNNKRWISPPATWNTIKPPSHAIKRTTNSTAQILMSFLRFQMLQTLVSCLATKRCKNFGPSFLQRHFPARAGRFCCRRSLGRTFPGNSGGPQIADPGRTLILRSVIVVHENKALLGFVWQEPISPLPKLMLRGGGTVSPLPCRCSRSSWSIAR